MVALTLQKTDARSALKVPDLTSYSNWPDVNGKNCDTSYSPPFKLWPNLYIFRNISDETFDDSSTDQNSAVYVGTGITKQHQPYKNPSYRKKTGLATQELLKVGLVGQDYTSGKR